MPKESKIPAKRRSSLVLGARLCVAGLGVGFVLGYLAHSRVVASTTQSLRENSSNYQFIHPLLVVNSTSGATATPQYDALRSTVNGYIASQTSAGAISSASVYFINYGKSGSYDPASMLKVVVMVAYLREADSDPAILNEPLVYTQAADDSTEAVDFADPSSLTVGTAYTVDQLIRSMIVDSDNGAMNLLIANIHSDDLNRTYTDLGLTAPEENAAYTISPKDYSLFFRVLYNATYLSRANSEKALTLLSQTTFKDGLVAGLPSGTTVAHKFGEHVNGTGSTVTSMELHDCGIVYAQGGPYLLCVMTKGQTLDGLEATITGISKMVYQDVSARK